MKTIKRKNKRTGLRAIVAILCILATLLIAGALYLIVFHGSLLGWQPFGSTASPQKVTSQAAETQDTTTGSSEKQSADGATDKTTDQVPVNDALAATFISLDESNGYVNFSGSANDTSSGGSCSIEFTNPNDRPVDMTVNATQQNGVAVCDPVQIPASEFTYRGDWTATFRYYTSGTSSQAMAERTITIQ